MAGEDSDLDQPVSGRVTDRDLLWVESVSERLLGHSAPRAWEKAFFQPEPEVREQAPAEPVHAQPAVAQPPASWSEPSPSEEPLRVTERDNRPPQATPAVSAVPDSAPAAAIPPITYAWDAPLPTRGPGPVRPPAQDVAPESTPSSAYAAADTYPGIAVPRGPQPAYFAEGDADWRHDLGPEFPDDPDLEGDVDEPDLDEPEAPQPTAEQDVVIDLTDAAQPQPPQPPAAPGRIDDEILRLALGSGDTVLASAVLLLLEDRARDRQRISTLDTALRALIVQVDRTDGPDHELAVTARLLRRILEY